MNMIRALGACGQSPWWPAGWALALGGSGWLGGQGLVLALSAAWLLACLARWRAMRGGGLQRDWAVTPALTPSASRELQWLEDGQGRLQWVSPSDQLLRGWPAAEVQGRPLSEVLGPQAWPVLAAALAGRPAAQAGGWQGPVQLCLPLADGQTRWFEFSWLAQAGSARGRHWLGRDISEQMALQARLRDSERHYLALGETASEGMAVVQDWCFRFVNRHLREFVGMREEELLGQPFLQVIHPEDHELLITNHRKRLAGESVPTRYEYRVLTRQYGVRWLEMSGSRIDWEGRPATLNFINDITRRKELEAQVRQLAFVDALTGLPNRRLLEDRLRMALSQSQRTQLHGAVIFLDLDNFKSLNDVHGHAAGDLLLVAAARRLQAQVRASDSVVRLGGDEFVVMLTPLSAQAQEAHAQAQAVAHKLCAVLSQPYELLLRGGEGGSASRPITHCCSASIGLSLFGPGEHSDEAVLQRADQAMYRAKSGGRNQVALAS